MSFSPWPVHIVEKANLCCGVLLNGLLMYLITKHSRVGLGAYRTLLLSFSAYDMFLSMLHIFMNPKIINVGTTFSVVSYSPIEHRRMAVLQYFSSFFCASFTVSFSIVNIHFLYRYWTVSKPARLAHFKDGRFIFGLLIYILADELTWHDACSARAVISLTPPLSYLRYIQLTVPDGTAGANSVRAIFIRQFNDTVQDGWLIVDYYQDGRLSPLALAFFISGSAKMLLWGFTSTTLAGLTYMKILEARDKSSSFHAIQLTFLKTVIAQAAVPTLFVAIPYLVVIFLPLMNWESSDIASYFPLMTSFFPPLDAIVIILMIKSYREAALGKLRCLKNRTKPAFYINTPVS